MKSVRRRPKLAKSLDAVLQNVDAEMAKLLAADPDLHLARQRALRRAGTSGSRRATTHPLATTY